VFERYNIVSPGDLKDAARKLDAAGQGQTGTFTVVDLRKTSAYRFLQ